MTDREFDLWFVETLLQIVKEDGEILEALS